MLSRLKKIAKRAGAIIVAGIVTLTVLPVIPVQAAETKNYHLYQNAKQVYDSISETRKIYTTPDNSELFWVTKSNKASSSSHLKYRTLGWRLVISGSGYSQKCDLILNNTIKRPAGALGEYETSYGKSSEKLNWDAIVSKKGETRVEHIKRHTVQNNSRETHSVFNGNPIDMVNDAWEQRHLVEPISDGMGGTIYNIPYKNAGYESGYINTGAQMDYITIVTLDESTDLITAFPSFGDYHK